MNLRKFSKKKGYVFLPLQFLRIKLEMRTFKLSLTKTNEFLLLLVCMALTLNDIVQMR